MAKGKFDDDFDLANLTVLEAAQFQDLLAKVWSEPFGPPVAAMLLGFRLPGGTSLPFVEISPDVTLDASGPYTAPATPEAAEPDAPTEADWDEVRRRALEIVGANLLDSPERHLAYIRERIARAASADV